MDKSKSGAGGGIKNRLTQMLLRSACTTTNTTTNTSTSFITLSKNGTNGVNKSNEEPPGTPSLFDLLNKHRYENKSGTNSKPKLNRDVSVRTAPVVQISIDCTSRRSLHGTNKLVPAAVPTKDEEKKKKEDEVKTRNKKKCKSNYSSKKCSPVSSSSTSNKFYYSKQETKKKKNTIRPKRNETKKLVSNPYGFSSSSSAGLFSSEGEEEEEKQTIFSSKSFSSDSSEFYRHSSKSNKTQFNSTHSNQNPTKKPVSVPKYGTNKETNNSKQPLVPVSSKERIKTGTGSSLAVMRKSSNPYIDFRSSMVEMILEERIVCVKEMETLLQSYLALNAERHHPVIVRAFEDICEAIFSKE